MLYSHAKGAAELLVYIVFLRIYKFMKVKG